MFGQQNQVNVGGKVYTITQLIGKGAQGAVYKGQSLQGEEVAIKYQNTISNNEYQILQSLTQNPKANIIGIKGVQREMNGNTVMVMELANNELYKYMTENPEYQTLSKDQRNQIFYQMVQAVKELHDLGYFHRDLKPENFVVFKKDANGYVKTKLIDLGLCKQQQNQVMHTRNVGTPYYMAPEIFDGSLLYDHSVDSWALGCIWFELMTEKTFFQGTDPNSLFQNIRYATQQQIDQRIESQQIFNQQEKQLLKDLIQKAAHKRIQVKELAQRLYGILNNNQINPNFNNNQNLNVFKTPIQQFPQFQNVNNQPKNFNIIQQNPNNIQAFQQQQNQQQMSDWKQKQQQQMQYEYEQKLKAELEQQKLLVIERNRKEEEQQKQILLEEQKRLEEQNQIKLKQMEEKLRKQNEEEQKKIELDKQKLRELQIEQELKMQNELEEEKKKFEEVQRKQQEELKRIADEQMQKQLRQKEEELKMRIAEQLKQDFQSKYIKKIQQQEYQQKQEMEKNFNETKNKIKKLIKNSKEQIEKFISSLEEKSQEKLISESQSIIAQQYKEFQDMILNFVNQFRSKIIQIEQNENVIQQMNDFEQLNQIEELENQLIESNQQIAQEQFKVLNTITQKYNQLISQLMNQKQLKEQLENQKKQQINQLQQLQIQNQSYNEQIKVLKSNLENEQKKSQQIITQLDEHEVSNQSKYINQNFQNINQQFLQFEQYAKEFTNQEISIQIMKYNQMNNQLFRMIEELKQIMDQSQQLNSKAEKLFQNLKTQTYEQIQQFQNCELRFELYHKQLNNEIAKLLTQGTSTLFQIKINEFKNLVTQMGSQLQQFENCLSLLQQNYNQNMMNQCQKLISDLNIKQNELSTLDTKIIQLNQQLERIVNQQNQIFQFKEENKKKFFQWDQQQQTLVAQFQNFSHISGEIKKEIDLLLKSFDDLKNQFIKALEILDQQKYQTEEQLRKQIDDNQQVSNTFMQKFEEKKSAAQILLQKLLKLQAVQDEKQQLFNQFNLQCNSIKQKLKQFKFDNIQIFNQIKQFSCKELMPKYLEYFDECKNNQKENSLVYQELTKDLQGKNSFPIQKNKVNQGLYLLFNNSQKALDDLNSFYNWSIQPYKELNFDWIEQVDDQQFQNLAKCKDIQVRVEDLNSENSDQYQKTLNGSIDNQDFVDKVKKELENLEKYQKELEQMKEEEIQQSNKKISEKINSWFTQMLLITIIQLYQNQDLFKRKYSKFEEEQNKQFIDEQRKIVLVEKQKQLLDELRKTKEMMLKCQSYLESKRFNELKSEELIENYDQVKKSFEKNLNEIKTQNRVKLRAIVKNQEVIKDLIEMTNFEELVQTVKFNKLKSLQMK